MFAFLRVIITTFLILLVLYSRDTYSQNTDQRRVLNTPGLVLSTNAPHGTSHVLKFTSDGENLLASGTDKVVRIWPIQDGSIEQNSVVTHRWAAWREQRGMIYTASFSNDESNEFIAIGGYGLITATTTVMKRDTGEIVSSTTIPGIQHAVSSIDFSPSNAKIAIGTVKGEVWLWNWKEKDQIKKLGRHRGDRPFVQLVNFSDETTLHSVSRSGQLIHWDIESENGSQPVKASFSTNDVRAAALATKRNWIIVAGHKRGENAGRIEIRSLDGQLIREIKLKERAFPRSIAVDDNAELIAFSVDIFSTDSQAFKPTQSQVVLYHADSKSRLPCSFAPSYQIDSISISPDLQTLGLAGGNDSEITLWDIDEDRLLDTITSPGSAIWNVAISKDSRYLAFKTLRNSTPSSFNDWGDGQPQIFDLIKRGWSEKNRDDIFERPIESLQGWRVVPDPNDQAIWYVVDSRQRKLRLPIDRDREINPRCYTFLKGKANGEVRLAVGHHFGFSVFQISSRGVTRSRLCIGHADEVTSLCASSDGKTIYSASRDQTISAWSLEEWPNQSELGASFDLRNNRLTVKKVAAGSPGWEAGLKEGDEISLLAFNGSLVAGGVRQWHEILKRPEPGKELFFRVSRKGVDSEIDMLTTVRQRPLWRFFPTRDGEWVLWRWRDYFYDTSTNGDSYIGWQVNRSIEDTPEFFEAEQFREMFHQPEKVSDIIELSRFSPQKVLIPELLPPKIKLSLSDQPEKEQFDISISSLPYGGGYIAEPVEISLWVNDNKYKRWTSPGERFDAKISVPIDHLRTGENRIIAQAYNKHRVRGESDSVTIRRSSAPETRRLYAMCIGVSDYSSAALSPNGKVLWSDLLFAEQDANAIEQSLSQAGVSTIYDSVEIIELRRSELTRKSILNKFESLRSQVTPNDLFVLFLAGHGYAKKLRENVYEPSSFTFVCPKFDIRTPNTSGVPAQDMYDAIAALSCRKIVLLDCCHSGSTNVLRDFAPEGIGPVMLAACETNQKSYDIPFFGHGAFTNALLESIGTRSSLADQNSDGVLTVNELFEYTKKRVPETIELARGILGEQAQQTPYGSIPSTTSKYELLMRSD